MRKGLGRHNRRSAGGPQPSLILDFAGTGTLDPRITFTRSTTGTYYNSSGVLTTAAINAPRFDYNPSTLAPLGLLIEQSSTNLLTYSSDYTQGNWTKSLATISPNTIVAPDGTTTASRVTFTTGGVLYQTQNSVVSSGASLTGTIYLKGVNGTTCRFYLQTGGGTYQASVLTVTLTSSWTRVTIPTLTLSDAKANVGVYLDVASSTATYVDIWGAQLEALAFSTSYIPTTSAQVTRASDNASMTGTNFSSWYNNAEGTVYTDAVVPTASYVSAISDGTANNYIVNRYNSSGASAIVTTSGTIQANYGSPTLSGKNASTYKVNDFASSVNGASPATDTSGSIPTVNQLQIGSFLSANYANGTIKKIAYYPIRVTNTQLQALTGS